MLNQALRGKVAIVTGASKGIGRVLSQVFAREGASVVCAARSRDLVEETARLVTGVGGQPRVHHKGRQPRPLRGRTTAPSSAARLQ